MRIEELTSDSVFRCLADERRRHILGYFRNNDGDTASFDDLVDYVTQREGQPTAPDRETVAIDLYHRHLPMLANYGVIDVDDRTESVRYTGDGKIEAVLGDEPGRSIRAPEAADD
ncbi:ArsR family transcriptional regulator [Halogeometricum sp. S1BR25-6]|uniref:ArsR family transcriptional regulator n=1 Tax=Halogeometricum salsisoli TaxID=2950536 RepID=A0ABU2GC05_9EURY|nr:ArsR family transcriptional regulator [Halogeometricum sp. S1BR25-6]MDS0298274.1 ArsR family transcriptional regulator [Halogeometricum sp. S1BR25-6]